MVRLTAIVRAIQLRNLAAQDLLGRILKICVQSGRDRQPAAQHRLRAEGGGERIEDVTHRVRGAHLRGCAIKLKRLCLGLGCLIRTNNTGPHHRIENLDLTSQGQIGLRQRIVAPRSLRQPRQQRRFRQIKIAHRLAKIRLSRRLHPVAQPAIVDLVQIHGQNIGLAEARVQLQGQHRLAQLAPHAALLSLLWADQDRARQLLRDRRAARHNLAVAQVRPCRPRNPAQIHARVLVETGVLHRNRGLLKSQRNLAQGHGILPPAERVRQRVEQRAVAVKDARIPQTRPRPDLRRVGQRRTQPEVGRNQQPDSNHPAKYS